MRLVRNEYSAGAISLPYELFSEAWDECIELQCNPKLAWMNTVMQGITHSDRTEIKIYEGNEILGGAVFALEPCDPHVGRCMYIVFQYVRRKYRNQGISKSIYKELLLEAKRYDCTTIAFTHREGDWKYLTTYKVIDGKDN